MSPRAASQLATCLSKVRKSPQQQVGSRCRHHGNPIPSAWSRAGLLAAKPNWTWCSRSKCGEYRTHPKPRGRAVRIGSSMCGRRRGVSISPSISPSQECANPQSVAPLPGHFSRFRGQRAARSTRGPDLRRPPTSSRTPPCPFLGRRSSCRRQLRRMERQLHRAKHLLDG